MKAKTPGKAPKPPSVLIKRAKYKLEKLEKIDEEPSAAKSGGKLTLKPG
jgi:hypothetical protein